MPPQLRLLGSISILVDGAWQRLPPHNTTRLLAFLAFEGDWTLRQRLAFLFWPDSDETDARRNLRQLLQRVRQLPWLAAPPFTGLEIDKQRVRWSVDTDVARFRRAIAAHDWDAAVELYGGELGTGLPESDCPAYEAWLEVEREALHGAWRNALMNLAGQRQAAGRDTESAELLERLLDVDPLAEDVLQHYLRSAAAAGQRQAAIRAYERFAHTLQAELALEPLPETVALLQSVSQGVAPLASPEAGLRKDPPSSLVRPPRIVGRDLLRREALACGNQVVWLCGEAGSGKTRLLHELAPQAPAVRCLEGLQGVPFAPVAALVRKILESGMEPESLGGYADDLARLVPEVTGLRVSAPEDPNVGRTRLLEALSRMFEAAAGAADRFQLVFDDLQWADESTLELLSYLVSQQRVRCLAAFRSDEVSPTLARTISALPQGRRFPLEPLSPKEVQSLLADLIGSGEGPELFSRWLHRHGGGNPFFILETLASLFEAGDLMSDGHGWHSRLDEVTRDYGELMVPSVVRELVSRRLARLSKEGLRVIQALSVSRTRLPPRDLGRVSGLSEWGALAAHEEAEGAGLITDGDFRHDLVRQVAYANLPEARRTLLHASVAEVLAGDAEPAVLAEHWLAAGEDSRALAAWLEAAHSFRERGLHDAALAILSRAEENSAGNQATHRVMAERARILIELSRNEEAVALARSVLAVTGDAGVRALMLDIVMSDQLLGGRVNSALDLSAQALELAHRSGDPTVIRQLVSKQAVLAHLTGDYERALALWLPYLEEAKLASGGIDAVRTLSSVASLYDSLGRQQAALPLHLRALELARQSARYAQVDVAINLLYCYMDLGEPAKGIPIALEALSLGRFDGSDGLRTNLAAAYLDLGDLTAAAEHYRCLTSESNDLTLLLGAWGRLVDLDNRLEDPAAAGLAIKKCLELLPHVEALPQRARALISVLQYGTPEQISAVGPHLESLDRGGLPDYLRSELQSSESDRGITMA